MKNVISRIQLIGLIIIAMSSVSLAQTPQSIAIDPFDYDVNGNPYMRDEMIVKFNPDLVNLAVIDDTTILEGTVQQFVNPVVIQMVIDGGYFDPDFANLSVEKIHPWLTSSITTTVTRTGEKIDMPKFWSTFIIHWDAVATGISFAAALDTLNKLAPTVIYSNLTLPKGTK